MPAIELVVDVEVDIAAVEAVSGDGTGNPGVVSDFAGAVGVADIDGVTGLAVGEDCGVLITEPGRVNLIFTLFSDFPSIAAAAGVVGVMETDNDASRGRCGSLSMGDRPTIGLECVGFV